MSPPLRRALASAAVPVLPFVFLVLALLPASVATQTGALDARGVHVGVESQSPPRVEERGISGYVLGPDGLPVTGGTVTGAGDTASIGSNGRFRLVPRGPGLSDIVVSVPGLATHAVKVNIPTLRTLRLPVIRLSPATYFRARFVSSTGEAILVPRLIRRSLDARGEPIPSTLQGRVDEQIDSDGTLTLGPLPRGVTTLAIDTPPLARTRLPDVWVMGDTPLIDGGTIVVEPGASLNVDVVDEAGAPLVLHDVSLEDTAPLSPITFALLRTNKEGRVTFDRLGAGRYRVRTPAKGRCDFRPLTIERNVTVPRAGSANTRIVAGGTAVLRFTSPLGPLRGNAIAASPESSTPPAQGRPNAPFIISPDGGRVFRSPMLEMPCRGTTDGDGRVTLNNFPPGPTRIEVRQLNSTWIRTVTVPPEGRELTVEIPTGYLPVRVLDAQTGGRVAGASVTWTAGRARVEASASASGEALLEGVARLPGTLVVRSDRHEPAEVKLQEPPDVLYEVTLERLAAPAGVPSLRARVTTDARAPLANAVVELTPEDPLEVGHVAVTDATGFVLVSTPPSRPLRLTAAADGFVLAATRIAEATTGDIVLTLSRGYRVIGDVESSIGEGRHPIRIVGTGGASMDHLLDAASDRSLTPPARVTLGPLPPGAYVVELQGPRGQWQAKVTIVDRDVPVTFR